MMPENTRYPWLRPGEQPTRLDEFEASARERANDPYKPRVDYDSPALADNAGPVETLLNQAAAHRLFMASVARPGPRRRPGGCGL